MRYYVKVIIIPLVSLSIPIAQKLPDVWMWRTHADHPFYSVFKPFSPTFSFSSHLSEWLFFSSPSFPLLTTDLLCLRHILLVFSFFPFIISVKEEPYFLLYGCDHAWAWICEGNHGSTLLHLISNASSAMVGAAYREQHSSSQIPSSNKDLSLKFSL